MSRQRLINALNRALAQERTSVMRYLVQARICELLEGDSAGAHFRALAEAEKEHTHRLRHQLYYLGTEPGEDFEEGESGPVWRLEEMLAMDVAEEGRSIALYRELLGLIEQEGTVDLRQAIQEILTEEEAHVQELEALAA